jgi:hypothetical protein
MRFEPLVAVWLRMRASEASLAFGMKDLTLDLVRQLRVVTVSSAGKRSAAAILGGQPLVTNS